MKWTVNHCKPQCHMATVNHCSHITWLQWFWHGCSQTSIQ